MQLLEKVSLADHSTMGLGGNAAYLTTVTTRQEVQEAVEWAAANNLPSIMIGSGSNIVWRDEGFPGLVIVNQIPGYEVYQEDEDNYYITIGGGELWDSVVDRTVDAGLTGIEALSLIPGSAGATPVQNVGAYGQEISNTLTTLEAYDAVTKSIVTMPSSDCGFGYRTSRFKTTDRGRFYITSITLHLMRGQLQPPYYASLQSYFDQTGLAERTPLAIRQAVIAIRNSKLPNPAVVHNTGSFFGNPIVLESVYNVIRDSYDPVPHWPAGKGRVKLSAAWLIEQAGFKDFHDPITGMGIWPKQSLVLVNEHATSTADLLKFKQTIVDTVQQKFQVILVQEPELLP